MNLSDHGVHRGEAEHANLAMEPLLERHRRCLRPAHISRCPPLRLGEERRAEKQDPEEHQPESDGVALSLKVFDSVFGERPPGVIGPLVEMGR